MSNRVLIIEDEYALAAALATVVRRLGGEPVVAASGQGGIDKAGRQEFAAVLLDLGLPDMSGLKVLAAIRAAAAPPPVLIITAHGTLDNALEARRLGAQEYFLKPLDLAEIQPCLRSLLATAATEAGPKQRPPVAAPENAIMVGAAPAMQRCFAVIAQACATTVPVLLHGARGTGKSLAAQVIHRNGANGSSLLTTFRYDEWPETAAESALGDAVRAAAGGTLLVEEIAALPLPLQAVLTRELAEGGRTRLLATTAQPLAELVGGGRFRDDLFYQISVLQVALPPLTQRTDDIPALASYLLSRAAPNRELSLSPEALACLKAYEWPGNVRELAAATQHAAAVCATNLVMPRHLPPEIAACTGGEGASASHLEAALNRALVAWLDQRVTGPDEALPEYDILVAQVEKLMLAELLRRFDDKPTRLAAALQMNRATLRRKLRDLLGRD
jgi:DNA-binding NtrC family response regulator